VNWRPGSASNVVMSRSRATTMADQVHVPHLARRLDISIWSSLLRRLVPLLSCFYASRRWASCSFGLRWLAASGAAAAPCAVSLSLLLASGSAGHPTLSLQDEKRESLAQTLPKSWVIARAPAETIANLPSRPPPFAGIWRPSWPASTSRRVPLGQFLEAYGESVFLQAPHCVADLTVRLPYARRSPRRRHHVKDGQFTMAEIRTEALASIDAPVHALLTGRARRVRNQSPRGADGRRAKNSIVGCTRISKRAWSELAGAPVRDRGDLKVRR